MSSDAVSLDVVSLDVVSLDVVSPDAVSLAALVGVSALAVRCNDWLWPGGNG